MTQLLLFQGVFLLFINLWLYSWFSPPELYRCMPVLVKSKLPHVGYMEL